MRERVCVGLPAHVYRNVCVCDGLAFAWPAEVLTTSIPQGKTKSCIVGLRGEQQAAILKIFSFFF